MFQIENLFSIHLIKPDWIGLFFSQFASYEVQNIFRIVSEWFPMVQKQIFEWLGFEHIGFLSETTAGELVQNQSDSSRFDPRHLSKWIRMSQNQVFNPN